MFKKIITAIAIVGVFFLFGLGHVAYGAEERQWYAFMVNEECMEVKALTLQTAICAMEVVKEERKFFKYRVVKSCPGMLADDYFYDFTFKECF